VKKQKARNTCEHCLFTTHCYAIAVENRSEGLDCWNGDPQLCTRMWRCWYCSTENWIWNAHHHRYLCILL